MCAFDPPRKRLNLFVIFCLMAILLLNPAVSQARFSANYADIPQPIAPPDFFGIVGRDPWYDFNTDPKNPNQPNRAFQENMAQQLQWMGAKWVRIEFHADPKGGVRGGLLDFAKYDSFINDIAPKYGLKILALVGSGTTLGINPDDQNLNYAHLNDQPDQEDGSNPFIRFFANRLKEISDHYGDNIAAFELLNEPNNWGGIKANPENLGILTTLAYDQVKPDHPNVKLILGATAATGDPYLDHVGYLTNIYNSKGVLAFKARTNHVGENPFPFDGVAWHPYFVSPWDSLYTADQAIAVMRRAGDVYNKLWITETGVWGAFNNQNCTTGATNKADDAQAYYLRVIYQEAAKRQQDIAAVFWFKYEDFYDNGQVQPFGLVHLSANRDNYSPYPGKIVRYKPAYLSYQQLALPPLPTVKATAPTAPNSASTRYFPETEHNLAGPFLKYWQENGGLDLFGYPLTDPYPEINQNDGKTYIVQWFERERFEYHPEFAGTKYEVLLGLLGNELTSGLCKSFKRAVRIPAPPNSDPKKPAPPPDRYYFNETGHNLLGTFKAYWDKKGGLAIFGYPISEEFGEANPEDGKFYVVQYFERARFELHPESKGTDYEVQLGLFGKQALKSRSWL